MVKMYFNELSRIQTLVRKARMLNMGQLEIDVKIAQLLKNSLKEEIKRDLNSKLLTFQSKEDNFSIQFRALEKSDVKHLEISIGILESLASNLIYSIIENIDCSKYWNKPAFEIESYKYFQPRVTVRLQGRVFGGEATYNGLNYEQARVFVKGITENAIMYSRAESNKVPDFINLGNTKTVVSERKRMVSRMEPLEWLIQPYMSCMDSII